ncbi:MAG: type II 3-dehydroquinate dehydratase, partial [Candidatus Blochmannia sp. A2]|nr:type II 3-dehydroquinate dehydratase [Candidatus Blochmannia sp. A2]
KKAQKLNISLQHMQSNAEHVIIDTIHSSKNNIDYIIINPAAFAHTSRALRDALLAVNIPFIEVHISNIYARENFRSHSW